MIQVQPDIRVRHAMSAVQHRRFLMLWTAEASSGYYGKAVAEVEHQDHLD
jgi:hypothetical protein